MVTSNGCQHFNLNKVKFRYFRGTLTRFFLKKGKKLIVGQKVFGAKSRVKTSLLENRMLSCLCPTYVKNILNFADFGAKKGLNSRFAVSNHCFQYGGPYGARTHDLLHAMEALSQLS